MDKIIAIIKEYMGHTIKIGTESRLFGNVCDTTYKRYKAEYKDSSIYFYNSMRDKTENQRIIRLNERLQSFSVKESSKDYMIYLNFGLDGEIIETIYLNLEK